MDDEPPENRLQTWQILLQLAAILLAARTFGEIAERLNIPSIIGELAAGVLLGPSLLGWIAPNDVLALLAEIGIILLLFEVGLETDVSRLVHSGRQSAVVAVIGFGVPFVLGYWLARDGFGLSVLVSLFIAGTLTATSIGVTIRILGDLGRSNHREGQIVLGAAVIDDLLGVFLLATLYEFATSGSVSWANAGRVIGFTTLFFVLGPVIARLVSPFIHRFHRISSRPGIIPTAIVSLVLLFAALAHMVGAPELLGGFIAGIALSRRFFLPFGMAIHVDPAFTTSAHEQMKPIIQLFTPIFFVMVGLSLDLSAIDWTSSFIWLFSLGMVAVAIIGKLLGGLLLVRQPRLLRVAVGMAMVPRGEVGLIFAELGRLSGIFDEAIYGGLVLVIAYTTLLAPFWIKLFYRVFGNRFPANGDVSTAVTTAQPPPR